MNSAGLSLTWESFGSRVLYFSIYSNFNMLHNDLEKWEINQYFFILRKIENQIVVLLYQQKNWTSDEILYFVINWYLISSCFLQYSMYNISVIIICCVHFCRIWSLSVPAIPISVSGYFLIYEWWTCGYCSAFYWKMHLSWMGSCGSDVQELWQHYRYEHCLTDNITTNYPKSGTDPVFYFSFYRYFNCCV